MRSFFQKIWGTGEAAGSRNQAVLECLKGLDFPPARIRRALLELNGVRIKRFVDGRPPSMVYQTIQGTRKDAEVRQLVARELGLEVQEIFPE